MTKSILFKAGIFAGEATERRQLVATINALLPVCSGHQLLRLGPQGDGGYLIPDDVSGIALGLSAGVAGSWGFEEQLRDDFRIPSVLIDRVDDTEAIPFPVDNAWLGPITAQGYLSLDDWVSLRAPGDQDLLLQMDIEGAEWMTLVAARTATLRRFRVMVIELHGLHRMADKATHDQVMAPLLRRLDGDFVCVHAHANNAMGVDQRSGIDIPYLLETTWLRRDRAPELLASAQLPHALDFPNEPGQTDLKLSSFWSSRCP